jgi:hypothetical protein
MGANIKRDMQKKKNKNLLANILSQEPDSPDTLEGDIRLSNLVEMHKLQGKNPANPSGKVAKQVEKSPKAKKTTRASIRNVKVRGVLFILVVFVFATVLTSPLLGEKSRFTI